MTTGIEIERMVLAMSEKEFKEYKANVAKIAASDEPFSLQEIYKDRKKHCGCASCSQAPLDPK